jgi:uncharacterized protein with beta-barrel porin domain
MTPMPFARAEIVHVSRDAPTEGGADPPDLDVDAADITRGYLQAGVEARATARLDGRPPDLPARLSWDRRPGDDTVTSQSSLTAFGVGFTTDGIALGRTRAVLDLGASWQMSDGGTAHSALRATLDEAVRDASVARCHLALLKDLRPLSAA